MQKQSTHTPFSSYPFGSPMPTRSWTDENRRYRYGFNGMERDDEVKGGGNSYDFGARILDSRLGRWLSLDPLMLMQPASSPYTFAYNNPIIYIDPNGKYPLIVISTESTGYTVSKTYGHGRVKAMVVPTYKMIIYDVNENGEKTIVGTHNVTRDGWFNQNGSIDKSETEHLVNRTTEPLTESDQTVGATPTKDYGKTLGAYALDPITVVPYPEDWDTYDSGAEVFEAARRTNPNVATSVMIHVGGVYEDPDGLLKLGGTYGCFGVVSSEQVFDSEKEALKFGKKAVKAESKKKTDVNMPTSNKAMNQVVLDVQKAIKLALERKEKKSSDIKVEIKKREYVEDELYCE